MEIHGNALSKIRTDRDSYANKHGIADHWLTTGSLVYFVTPIRSRRVKIGTTTNLRNRLRTLQANNHVTLTVLLTMAGDIAIEGQLHERFKAYRMRNEWFSLSDEIKEFIVTNGGQYIPPAGSYTLANRATEEQVRAAMAAAEVRPDRTTGPRHG